MWFVKKNQINNELKQIIVIHVMVVYNRQSSI